MSASTAIFISILSMLLSLFVQAEYHSSETRPSPESEESSGALDTIANHEAYDITFYSDSELLAAGWTQEQIDHAKGRTIPEIESIKASIDSGIEVSAVEKITLQPRRTAQTPPFFPGSEKKIESQNYQPTNIVRIGDDVSFEINSRLSGYYLLVIVDKKGHISVIKPDAHIPRQNRLAATQLIYPAITSNGSFTYAGPPGRALVYAIYSEAEISLTQLGLEDNQELLALKDDRATLGTIVDSIQKIATNSGIDYARYEYFVDL